MGDKETVCPLACTECRRGKTELILGRIRHGQRAVCVLRILVAPGTFSGLLFSVSQDASKRNSKGSINQLNGYDINTKSWVTHVNNNNGGFLKAVLHHLLP